MIKEFKDDGCRFMCKCIPGSVSVFDMDVDDGVEVVEFESEVLLHLKHTEKQGIKK